MRLNSDTMTRETAPAQRKHRSARRSDPAAGERGVLLPIIAVMALGVIGTLVILGVETARVKDVATILRGHNERICKNVAQGALVPDEAVRAFRNEIRNLAPLGNGVEITQARLILPLPIDDDVTGLLYDFTTKNPCTAATFIPSFAPPSGEVPEVPFASIHQDFGCAAPTSSIPPSPGAPALKSGVDCTFRYDICQNTSPDPKYPAAMWSDLRSAGNTIGCELTAEVVPLFGFTSTSPREVQAKVAWSIPLISPPPFIDDPNLPLSQAAFSGISLGIAPHLTTWAGTYETSPSESHRDNRFKFDSGYPSDVTAIDPRRTQFGCPPDRFTTDNPIRTRAGYGFMPLLPRMKPTPIPGTVGLCVNRTMPIEDLVTACLNPPVLIRNIITSTIVELAARHGESRNLFELAYINPQHRDWTTLNRPVVAVEFGQDIAQRRFQHPFVTFNAGNTPPVGLGDIRGFTLPWNFDPASPTPYPTPVGTTLDPSKTAKTNALLTQQLRMCLHLYRNSLSPRQPLPLQESVLFPGPLPPLLPNAFDFAPSLQPLPPSVQNWDYPDPWGTGAPAEQLLTAAELAYSTGSVQRCPLKVDGTPPNYISDNFLPCPKTGFNPLEDLLPDLRAYLTLQANEVFSNLEGEHPYYSPGLWEPRQPAGPGVNSPITTGEPDPENPMMGGRTTSVPPRPRSIVAIAVHKGLPGAEVGALRTLVRSINGQRRPVIIFFIPTTTDDSNLASNYCLALDLDPSCNLITTGPNPSNPNARFNKLVWLSPFNAQYGTTYTEEAGVPLQPWESFRKYWIDLLTKTGTSNELFAYTIARNVFATLFLRHEPIL
jgi:hypothetical protein